MAEKGWIGVDLDGTLAYYSTWKSMDHIGKPIEPMVDLVKDLLARGQRVKIFTARVCSQQTPEDLATAIATINEWCLNVFGQILEITAEKDWLMLEYYDDRAISVELNTGRILNSKEW